MTRLRLVTIPFSHYCEKARWALDRAGLAHDEEKHLPILHVPFVRRAGGTRMVPILVTPEGVVEESTAIVAWADRGLPEAARLLPTEGPLADEVRRWVARFDAELGPHTRRWAYRHLLPDRARVLPMLGLHVAGWERAALAAVWPAARRWMERGMKIDEASAARSLAKVERVFADVDRALEDGRRYLAGERFTAADLTFATLAAPLLLPDGYARWLGGADRMPPAMRGTVEALRATPAGRFGTRLYDEERAVVVAR